MNFVKLTELKLKFSRFLSFLRIRKALRTTLRRRNDILMPERRPQDARSDGLYSATFIRSADTAAAATENFHNNDQERIAT